MRKRSTSYCGAENESIAAVISKWQAQLPATHFRRRSKRHGATWRVKQDTCASRPVPPFEPCLAPGNFDWVRGSGEGKRSSSGTKT